MTALRGEALDRAGMTLGRIAASISTPKYLEASETRDAARHPLNTEPSLAAQHAYVAGRLAWRNGDPFDAMQKLELALRLAPNNPDILRLLGRIYTSVGNRIRGALYLRQAVKADPDDLRDIFLLGRFAMEERQWHEAIAIFHAARERLARQTASDATLARLVTYDLASALSQGGYAAAAIHQYQRFLTAPPILPPSTALGRELTLLYEQKGDTWEAVGDLELQLGKPKAGLQAYEQAGKTGVVDRMALVRREVYANLRVGRDSHARQRVIEQVEQSQANSSVGPDAASLELVRYLAHQHVSTPGMAQRLETIYREHDRPATLAITLAEVLPRDQAVALLVDHLRARPSDDVVLDHLLNEYLLPQGAAGASADNVARAIRTIAELMEASPNHAEDFALALRKAARDMPALLSGFAPLPAQERQQPMVSMLEGLTLSGMGKIDEAQPLFERAFHADPSLEIARLELAKVMILRGRFDQAATLLEPLADSKAPHVIALRVEVLGRTGHVDQALALLDEMIQAHAGDRRTVALVLQKANLQLGQNDASGAAQTLLDALNIHPTNEQLYQTLLDLYDPPTGLPSPIPNATQQWQRLVRRLLGAIPNSRIGRLVRANLLDAKGDFDQAQKLLKGLLDENPHDARALRQLLALYLRANRRDDALALLNDRVSQNLHDPQLLRIVGRFYKDLGKYDRMFDVVERYLKARPPNQDRTAALASLYLDDQKPQNVIHLLRPMLYEDKINDPERVMNLLGQALLELKQHDQAHELYEQAIKRFPGHGAELGYDWATLVGMRGDEAASQKLMLANLKRYPDHAPTNNAAGYAWAAKGEHLEQAKAMIQKAVDSDPHAAAYLDSLGWVNYKLGRFDEAKKWLTQARQASGGQNPVILDHLGDALYRLGDHEQAVRTWRQSRARMQSGLAAQWERVGDVLYQTGRVADAVHLWMRVKALQAGQPLSDDPEMKGLVDRLTGKINAVKAKQGAAVAASQ